MDIAYAFLAEAAQITADGRLNIQGADIPELRLPGQPPWVLPSLSLVASVRFEKEDFGRLFHFTMDLVSPEERRIEPRYEDVFIAAHPDNPDQKERTTVVLQMKGLPLRSSGMYRLQFKVEDRDRPEIQRERAVLLGVQSEDTSLRPTA